MSNLNCTIHLRPSDEWLTGISNNVAYPGGWVSIEGLALHFHESPEAAINLAIACLELARLWRIKEAAEKAGDNGQPVQGIATAKQPIPFL